MCEGVLKTCDDARHLRNVARLRVRPRAIGVHLRRRRVLGRRVGPTVAHRRAHQDTGLHDGLVDDRTTVISLGDVRHLLDGGDHGLVPLQLRAGLVGDEVEAVRDGVPRWDVLAVARGLRRRELGVVRVGRLVQVSVHEHRRGLLDELHDAGHGERRLLAAGLVEHEAAVGVDGLGVPPVDRLVAPRADAGQHEHVDPLGVLGELLLDEHERAVDAAGLVAMHAAGDNDQWTGDAPVLALDGVQWVLRHAELAVVERAVLEDVTVAEAHETADDIVEVVTLLDLLGAPLRELPLRPGLTGDTDVVASVGLHNIVIFFF
eukprot:PhM_4_TR12457/c0_g1_i2/m.26484